MNERKNVQSWLPQPVYDELTALAKRNERSVGAELRIAIAEHLRLSNKSGYSGVRIFEEEGS